MTLTLPPALERILQQPLAQQFLRFAAVGAGATCVHYAILIAMVELAHRPLVLATSLGFCGGAVVSYTLNRRLTFSHQPHFGLGLLKFVAVGLVGLGLNAAIVVGLTNLGLPYMIAQMAATGLVLIWNFTLSRLLIFKAP